VPESEWDTVTALLYGMGDLADQQSAADSSDRLLAVSRTSPLGSESPPANDIISGVCSAERSDAAMAKTICLLLFAGNSVAAHIGNGMVRLLADTELRANVLKNPELLPTAVEELLRTASLRGWAHPHYALDGHRDR